jgi:hypothetical protein
MATGPVGRLSGKVMSWNPNTFIATLQSKKDFHINKNKMCAIILPISKISKLLKKLLSNNTMKFTDV